MTSSLVGSEMCIRDRARRSDEYRRASKFRCCPKCQWTWWPHSRRRTSRRSRRSSGPVSYTHLRAHETRRHL
eukprot:9114345-Prorocentrum_lima.AAC.1